MRYFPPNFGGIFHGLKKEIPDQMVGENRFYLLKWGIPILSGDFWDVIPEISKIGIGDFF